MKKLLALLLVMLMCVPAYADVNPENVLDIEHNTAVLFLGDDMCIEFDSLEIEEDSNSYTLTYMAQPSEILTIFLAKDVPVGYYYVDELAEDEEIFGTVFESDYGLYTALCLSPKQEDYGTCDVVLSAVDEDNWYQGMAVGKLMDLLGETDFVLAFDFVTEPVEETIVEELALSDESAEDVSTSEELTASETEATVASGIADVALGDMMYSLTLYETLVKDGMIYARFADESGNIFAICFDETLEAGAYHPESVDRNIMSCGLLTPDGKSNLGGCDNYNNDYIGDCMLFMDEPETDGHYSFTVIGEAVNDDATAISEIVAAIEFTMP